VRDGYDQIVDVLGADYYVAHQSLRGDDGSGNSIASRWPFGEVRELDLFVTPRVGHGWLACLTVAEIRVPDPVGLLLLVHHKPSGQLGLEYERELQAVAAARFVEELVGERRIHVILTGDFDSTPDAANMRFWRGRQSLGGMSVCYRDAWESVHPDESGHTFTPHDPLVAYGELPLERGRRIDHILVRCDDYGPTLDVITCARVLDEPVNGIWASDHFGVMADLAVPTASPAGSS